MITQSATYSSRPWREIVFSPRSAVMTAVTPFPLSHRNRRRSSDRRIASFESPAKSDSIVSSTTRFAPIESMACPSRMNSPSRSYSPVSWISVRSIETKSTRSFFRAARSARSKPREATFCARSRALSSNAMKTPGSPCSRAPRTRNSIANSVFPQPAEPATSVGRPRGSPPPVISSRPRIPLGHLGIPAREKRDLPAFLSAMFPS